MTNLLDEEEVEADDDDVLGTSPSVSNCLPCCGSFVAVLLSHSWSLLAKKKKHSLSNKLQFVCHTVLYRKGFAVHNYHTLSIMLGKDLCQLLIIT